MYSLKEQSKRLKETRLTNSIKTLSEMPQAETVLSETLDLESRTYTRELFIPKGTLIVGYKHRQRCLNILAKGEMIITDIDSQKQEHIKVDQITRTFWTEPNTQKIGYALEDSIFLNVFTDVPTDPKMLFDHIIEPVPGFQIETTLTKEISCQ